MFTEVIGICPKNLSKVHFGPHEPLGVKMKMKSHFLAILPFLTPKGPREPKQSSANFGQVPTTSIIFFFFGIFNEGR